VARLFSGDCTQDDSLQTQIESLIVENSKLKSLAPENESLKSAMGFIKESGDNSISARVIYESDDGATRMLVIDRGRVDGLSVGMPVIAGDGVIIGKISTIRQRTASIMPLTDSRSRLAVTVQNSQGTLGILEGDRGLSLSFKLVPQTEQLTIGDTVITSGLERGIRRGLVVGTIDKIHRPPREPFQSASIAQFSTWKHPLFIFVLKSQEGGEAE
jgi:rod shape-determining protein MreC